VWIHLKTKEPFAFAGVFVKTKCCSSETIQSLLRTPRIREHLKPVEKKLLRLGIDLRSPREKIEQARIEAMQPARLLLSRYNREQLYDEVWSEPVLTVARKYGLSDVGLAKVCKNLSIPSPGLGYWAKKAAGKYVGTRPPLPSLPGFCRN
jgi:hypothetical protein